MSIATNLKEYDYFEYGKQDKYGQEILNQSPSGKVKASITLLNQSVENTPLYNEIQYVGLTHSNAIKENCVIAYGNKKLKVMNIVEGRYNTLLLQDVG